MKREGFVLRDLLIIITIPLVLGLIIYAIYYNFKEDTEVEDTRGVAQNVEQGADMYYKNFILRPEEYSETFFDLKDPSSPIRRFFIGRKPDGGQVYIRPVNDIKSEISLAVHYGKYCATKYYGESKFKIRKATIEKCVLDQTRIIIDN